MRKFTCIFISGILFLSNSCKKADPNKTIDEGSIQENLYTSEELGWTIEIPKNWTITLKNEKETMQEKGFDAIKKGTDIDIDYSGLKNLIGFQKNKFNSFQSTSEPFELEYEGEWEKNDQFLKELMYFTFIEEGIKVDTSATTIETIDNLDFHTYSFTVYSPKGDLILTQIMYSRLINGLDFGVNISYNNEKDKEEMLNAWRNSKFRK